MVVLLAVLSKPTRNYTSPAWCRCFPPSPDCPLHRRQGALLDDHKTTIVFWHVVDHPLLRFLISPRLYLLVERFPPGDLDTLAALAWLVAAKSVLVGLWVRLHA